MFSDDACQISTDLAGYLREQWDDGDVQVDAPRPFGDGHSGFTYLVEITRSGATFDAVLRLSPPGARIVGPSDIGRQGQIMAALASTDVPVPAVHAYSSQGVIAGRSFALLEQVVGTGWEQAIVDSSDAAVARHALSVLRVMRALPVESTGLSAEVAFTPNGELARWTALLRRAPGWLAEPATQLADELSAVAPATGTVGLVHGDFHFGNLLFAAGAVVAVLDWEIAALSDPLFDLGGIVVTVLRRRYPDDPNPTGVLDVEPRELVREWGASEDEANWYIAAACLKYAAIFGYNLSLHRSGKRPDPVYEDLLATMRGLINDGREILTTGLPDLLS
jgi:aminoglycoside phosphotransferase (APT) family kinase protein